MNLVDRTVRELLAAFASFDPTPGGGSASALASAIGASLLVMVARLPKTHTGSDDERTALTSAATALASLAERLTAAVDRDTAAYDRVVAAYRLPKATDGEKAARTGAIQEALRAATDVPLGVMRLSADALVQARIVAAQGHRAAASDVGVGCALLAAGLRGARLNVDINLGSVSDAAYADRVRSERDRLAAEAAAAARDVDGLLGLGIV